MNKTITRRVNKLYEEKTRKHHSLVHGEYKELFELEGMKEFLIQNMSRDESFGDFISFYGKEEVEEELQMLVRNFKALRNNFLKQDVDVQTAQIKGTYKQEQSGFDSIFAFMFWDETENWGETIKQKNPKQLLDLHIKRMEQFIKRLHPFNEKFGLQYVSFAMQVIEELLFLD